jgi:diacylglycerol kinase (ATP)
VAPPRVIVIANPASGRGKAERMIPAVRTELKELGHGSELRISNGPDDPPGMAREAAEEGAEIVAAMGGDGMVGMVGAALVGSSAALGVIPTGTGNDFATFLGIKRKRPADALAGLRDPEYRDIDVVRLTTADGVERVFLNVAGAGFDSEVNETANRMRTRIQGTAKYVAAVFKTLRRFNPAQFRMSIDGGDEESFSVMLIAVGNGRSYGGGMKITPGASIDDGILEVCAVKAMKRGQFLRAFPKVFKGTHVNDPRVQTWRGKRIELAADRHFEVYADGEPSGPLPATFEVVPGALRLAVPRSVGS